MITIQIKEISRFETRDFYTETGLSSDYHFFIKKVKSFELMLKVIYKEGNVKKQKTFYAKKVR